MISVLIKGVDSSQPNIVADFFPWRFIGCSELIFLEHLPQADRIVGENKITKKSSKDPGPLRERNLIKNLRVFHEKSRDFIKLCKV